jgi:hypothetical protein
MKNILFLCLLILSVWACQNPATKPAEASTPQKAEPTPQIAATTPTFCYQFNQNGEHVYCQLLSAANGNFSGYYSWYIDGKDGAYGVLKGTNFFSDTLIADHIYMQEGSVASQEIIFVKKGDNLLELVGERMDKEGKMVVKDRRKLKAGNTLTKVDCAKIEKDFESIKAMEKDQMFKYPDPVLSEKEAKVAEKLVGEWQSKDDPKAGVKMENGKFTFLYEGKTKDAPMRYLFYPACPKDCNPVAKMPCLKIIGQDDVCYSIMKADGKSLDISQIGGTGNTNRYVKKK